MSQLSMDSFVVVSKKAPRVMPGRKKKRKGGRPKGPAKSSVLTPVIHTPRKEGLACTTTHWGRVAFA